jgi:hypothetical protein
MVEKLKKKGIIILHLIFNNLNEFLEWSKKIQRVFQKIIIIKQYELSIYLICLKDVEIEFNYDFNNKDIEVMKIFKEIIFFQIKLKAKMGNLNVK